MSVDTERLIAYADGELSGAERAEIEAALAQDEALREKLDAHRRLRAQLSSAFDGALDEPVPLRLSEALAEPSATNVVSLAARRAPRWSAREWSAMAASTVLGLVLGVGVMNAQAPMIATNDDGLIARGALARALDTQLASDEAGAVRIGLSFRAQDGRYCRTFDLTGDNTSGLACRDAETWSIAIAAHSASGGEIRQAGAPLSVLSAVDSMIDGEPLDASAEAQARDADWR